MLLFIQLESSQIAAHLMRIRDWSQRISSRIEQLEENADPVSIHWFHFVEHKFYIACFIMSIAIRQLNSEFCKNQKCPS